VVSPPTSGGASISTIGTRLIISMVSSSDLFPVLNQHLQSLLSGFWSMEMMISRKSHGLGLRLSWFVGGSKPNGSAEFVGPLPT
jgi:hypothetical protein